ncbi:hypothetical protein P154DRAFT_163844 [Amniculicola lignicola CBS 123094]|uniref:SET domain-containing protein n=1 Tax=Amniculicola lignicola CBS 123094 TaxID=1392246 RepID=A0A6A5WJ72_9PLEO|nr:hypothetical protein P154DRAFT_163844 [Amniculicola lignicola CBS 123094]
MSSPQYTYIDLSHLPEITPSSSEAEDAESNQAKAPRKDSRRNRRGGKKNQKKKKANGKAVAPTDDDTDPAEHSDGLAKPRQEYESFENGDVPANSSEQCVARAENVGQDSVQAESSKLKFVVTKSRSHGPSSSDFDTIEEDDGEAVLETPGDPMFEKRKINVGLPGLTRDGLFATVDIQPGTRILTEKPFLTHGRSVDKLIFFAEIFDKLTPSAQQRIMDLCPLPFAETEEMGKQVDRILEKHAKFVKDLEARDRSTWSKVETLRFAFASKLISDVIKQWRIGSRVLPNLISMVNLPEESRGYLNPRDPVTGLCLTIGQITHSCIPNCFAAYNTNLEKFTLHTTKFIPAGTQLTCTAIGHYIWYNPVADRAVKLATATPTCFRCTCDACDPSSMTFRQHEISRTHLAQLAETLSAFNNRQQAAAEGEEDWPTHEETETMVNATNALLSHLTIVGCNDVEPIRWRILLCKLLCQMKEWQPAFRVAKLNMRTAVAVWGKDSLECQPVVEQYSEVEEKVKALGGEGEEDWEES